MIHRALKLALRTGKYFRLCPEERAILWLSARVVKRVRSEILKKVLLNIFNKINQVLDLKIRVLVIGYKIAKKRVEQALKLGYSKAEKWIENLEYIQYLGMSYLNTPVTYEA